MSDRIKGFPLAWVTTGRTLLIIGGGVETDVRLRHALSFDWQHIRLVMASIPDDLRAIAGDDPRVELLERTVTEDDIRAAHLVIKDCIDRTLAAQVAQWCRAHRVPLNAVDNPEICDLYYQSLVIRPPRVLSIGSGGKAPAVAAALRRKLEKDLGPGWPEAARLLAEARDRLPRGRQRMNLLRGLSRDPRFLEYIEENNSAGMRNLINDAIHSLPDRSG